MQSAGCRVLIYGGFPAELGEGVGGGYAVEEIGAEDSVEFYLLALVMMGEEGVGDAFGCEGGECVVELVGGFYIYDVVGGLGIAGWLLYPEWELVGGTGGEEGVADGCCLD